MPNVIFVTDSAGRFSYSLSWVARRSPAEAGGRNA